MDVETPAFDYYAQIEIFMLYLIAGLGILLRNVVFQTIFKNDVSSKFLIFVLDFACWILPMVLVQTILADHIVLLIGTMLLMIASIIVVDIFSSWTLGDRVLLFRHIETSLAIRHSISWFRTMVFVSTSIAILAVDFEVFPKRFAKTSLFGISLMDSGTAAFVFANGLSDSRDVYKQEKRSPFLSLFSIRVPSFFVLLLMGVGRSMFMLLSGYQQNVTEYGVHWNFFVTLFFLRVFVKLFSYPYIIYAGFVVGCVYEICLTKSGLAEFILRDEALGRFGFVSENREGIFSLCGYIFLYSLALLYAKISISALQRKEKLSIKTNISHGWSFVLICIVLQMLAEYNGGLRASRRIANMPYTFAMAALFSFSVSGLQVLIYIVGAPPVNFQLVKYGVLNAISSNGLIHFLFSNIVTGLLNIFVLKKFRFDILTETVFIMLYVLFVTIFITIFNWKRVYV